jgi:2-haloacid dehalogenase
MAARRVGLPVEAILFVANHEFDCVGAKSAGMRTVFIDRRKRPFARWPHQPDLIVGSMTELAERLVSDSKEP